MHLTYVTKGEEEREKKERRKNKQNNTKTNKKLLSHDFITFDEILSLTLSDLYLI